MTDSSNDHKQSSSSQSLIIELQRLLKESFEKIAQSEHFDLPEEIPDTTKMRTVDDIFETDIRPHLERLHTLWNISRDPKKESGIVTVETESWFHILSEMNKSWDTRSSLDDLGFPDDVLKDFREHYPALLKQYLGLSPTPVEETAPLERLRNTVEDRLEKVHQLWNIDDQQHSNSRHSFKDRMKEFFKKIVRLHTDPIFQQQRDFNAQVVSLMETTINEIDHYQQRTARLFMEILNRQFLFNLLLVRFMNTFLQDIVFSRQKEFNAEIVQIVQKILERFPQLMLERSEILISKCMSELDELRGAVEKYHDPQGKPKKKK